MKNIKLLLLLVLISNESFGQESLQGRWTGHCVIEFFNEGFSFSGFCPVDKTDPSKIIFQPFDFIFEKDFVIINIEKDDSIVKYNFNKDLNSINFRYNENDYTFKILSVMNQPFSKNMIWKDSNDMLILFKEKEECLTLERKDFKMATEESSFLRGYGKGKSLDKSKAMQKAQVVAHNYIALEVQEILEIFIKKYNETQRDQKDMQLDALDKIEIEASFQQLVWEEFNASKIILSDVYTHGDGYYANVFTELTDIDFTKQAYAIISDNDKLRMVFNDQQFSEEWKKAQEDYRVTKMQNIRAKNDTDQLNFDYDKFKEESRKAIEDYRKNK